MVAARGQPMRGVAPGGAVIHQRMSESILKLSVAATLQYFIWRVAHSQEEERDQTDYEQGHSAPLLSPCSGGGAGVGAGGSLRAHSLRLLRQAALCNLSLMMPESNLSSSCQADSGSVVCEAAASCRAVTSSGETEGFYSVFLLSSKKRPNPAALPCLSARHDPFVPPEVVNL